MLFSDTVHTLENSLQYASAKNQAISHNIANVDTPGYKAKNVEFKNMLQHESSLQAKQTHAIHMSFGHSDCDKVYFTTTKNGTMYNHNGNNVDIDKEMPEFA